jgi:hypothetical protein
VRLAEHRLVVVEVLLVAGAPLIVQHLQRILGDARALQPLLELHDRELPAADELVDVDALRQHPLEQVHLLLAGDRDLDLRARVHVGDGVHVLGRELHDPVVVPGLHTFGQRPHAVVHVA